MDREAARALITETEKDVEAQRGRRAVPATITDALRDLGVVLWVGGYVMGPDRANGESPFAFGSDSLVGLATVTQIGGELCAGAVMLLDAGNLYGAAAMIRQLVEVQYLAWAFDEDPDEAKRWLRSDQDERRAFWAPRHLRERSGGRFPARDYSHHCDLGGHPTPDSRRLLPDHENDPVVLWWVDLALHSASIWNHVKSALAALNHEDLLARIDGETGPSHAVARWRESDRLLVLAEQVPHGGSNHGQPRGRSILAPDV